MTDGNAIFPPPPLSHVAGDYSDLKFQVKEAGLLTDDYSFHMWRIINSGAECTILSSDIKVALAFALTSELKMV